MRNKIIGIITVVLVIASVIIIGTCGRGKPTYQKTIDSLQLRNQTMDSMLNRDGTIIIQQKAIIVDNQKALNQLTDTIFRLKKRDQKNSSTLAYYKGSTVTSITHDTIPFTDTVYYELMSKACDSIVGLARDSLIKVPITITHTTPEYSLQATITKTTLVIDSLGIADTLQLRFVETTHGLFKPNTIQVQFFHSNPLITTTQSNSAIYKPKTKNKFLQWAVPILIGAGVGIIMSK